jgi:hypothetical protein
MNWKTKRALQKNKVFVELIKKLQQRLGVKALQVIDFHRAGELDWLVIARPDDNSFSMSINTYIPRDDFQVFLSSPSVHGSNLPQEVEGVHAKSFEELVAVIQKHFHHESVRL